MAKIAAIHRIAFCFALAFGAAPASASSWADIAKWPDFEGGQWAIKGSLVGNFFPAVKLTPEAEAKKAALATAPATGAAAAARATCNPAVFPGRVGGEFFYSKDSILLLSDWDFLAVRRIYMDGRGHGDPDPDPTYAGHSIGHWEGKTLVVDTVGFLPEIPLGGVPGNGATHIVERYRLMDKNTIAFEMTVTNPEILAEPLAVKKTLTRLSDLEVGEAFCSQNDRNAFVNGKEGVDLTPPQ